MHHRINELSSVRLLFVLLIAVAATQPLLADVTVAGLPRSSMVPGGVVVVPTGTRPIAGPHLHWSLNLYNTRVDPALFLVD